MDLGEVLGAVAQHRAYSSCRDNPPRLKMKTKYPIKKLGRWDLMVLTAFLNRSSSFSAKSEAILEIGVVARFT